jgi:coenzyme F420-reducing hydrogenase gamma subunit
MNGKGGHGMENYNCEECNYRRKDVTLCFPCMMQILAERRKKNRIIKEVKTYDKHEQK